MFLRSNANIVIWVKHKNLMVFYVVHANAVDRVDLFTSAACKNGINQKLKKRLLVGQFSIISRNFIVRFVKMSIQDILRRIISNMNFYPLINLMEIILCCKESLKKPII